MVHGKNGLYMVRIVRGTNSQWYENSSNLLRTASELKLTAFGKGFQTDLRQKISVFSLTVEIYT